jgi:hypothetical protein
MEGGRKRRNLITAATFFLVSVGIRLIGANFGLPHMYYWDECFLVRPLKDLLVYGALWPHFYQYPSGYIYLQFPGALASYLFFVIKNGPAPAVATALSDYLLISRSLTAAVGAAGVVLVYWFAVRLWQDHVAGVIAALTLTLSPLNVHDSRIFATDIPMATCAFAAVFLLSIYLERGDRKVVVAAGITAGAAVGLKYNAACFAAAAAFVVAIHDRDWRRPLIFTAAAALAFFALVPGAIFEYRIFFRDLLSLGNYYFAAGEPATKAVVPGWHYFGQLWSYGLTPGPLIVAFAGVIIYIYRRRTEAVKFLILPLPYVAFLVLNKVTYARNLEPLLPYGALFAGLAGSWVLKNLSRRFSRPVAGAIIVALAGAFTFRLVIVTARDTYLHLIVDDRTKAKEWFEATVPWPQAVAKEAANPAPPAEGGQTDAPPLDPDKYDIRVGPYIATNSAADYAYAGVVYIITPGLEANLRRLTFADPKNAPAYCHNYESIINNSQLVLRFEHPPWDFRPAVEIYRLNDEILRAYNPPRATIQFKPGWVLSERAPYKPVGRTPRGFVLRAPARGAACFTAPASRFVVEVELAGVGEAADIAVAIDGREVVRERIECDGVVRTPPLSAPPYYRHLAVRCPGPAGARAILINARAIAAE